MADNLFKDSNCPIDPVPRADFNFLPLGCDITPAPKPIYGCTLPTVPREPPTDVGRFCPEFKVITTLDVGYGGTQEDEDAGCIGPPSLRLELVRQDVDPCKYDLALDISIPIPKPPCPDINVSAFNVHVGYDIDDCLADKSSTFTITSKITPGDCNTPDICEFDVELEIVVPIPVPPCPQIYVNSVSALSPFVGKDYAADGSPLDIACIIDPINKLDVPFNLDNYTLRTLYYCRIDPFTGPVQWDTPEGIDCPCSHACCVFIYAYTAPDDTEPGFWSIESSYIDRRLSQTLCTGETQFPFVPVGELRGTWLSSGEACGENTWQPPPDCVVDSILYAFYRGTVGMAVSGEGVIDGTTSGGIVYPADPFSLNGWAIVGNNTAEGFLAAEVIPYVPVSKPITAYNGTPIKLTDLVVLTLEVTKAKVKETKLEITTVRTPGDCNNPDTCEFFIDLEVVTPIPRLPCPVIRRDTFTTIVGYEGAECLADKETRFDITTKHTEPTSCNDAGQCEFEFDLEIVIPLPVPPCPVINNKTFEVISGFVGADSDTCIADNVSALTITHTLIPNECNKPPECAFDFEILIVVPIPRTPCPIINAKSFLVRSGFAEDNCLDDAENRFEIASTVIEPIDCNDPGSCQFDVELEIVVPIPKPLCPTIEVNTFAVTVGYAGATNNSGELCVLDTPNVFKITPTVTPGDCNTPDQCSFAVDLEILVPIPKPPCPIINITNFDVAVGYDGGTTEDGASCLADKQNNFTITHTVVPGDCNTPDQCIFDVELEILVPIPKPPCPAIYVDLFDVAVGYEGADCITDKQNNFTITHTVIPGDCITPDQCDFNVNLEIVIPLPVPPCPVINTKTFEVVSGFVGNNNDTCVADNVSLFTITPTLVVNECSKAPECAFDFELLIVVPIPRTPCPVINAKNFIVTSGFADKNCFEDVENRFEITSTVIEPADCNDPGSCQFDLDLEIAVLYPRVPCVDITTRTFDVSVAYENSDVFASKDCGLSITSRHIPPSSCNDTGACGFDVDLTICVPIPKPLCPVITVQPLTQTVYYDSASCSTGAPPGSSITLTDNTTPGVNGAPDECSFDLAIDIAIPIPVPPCPVINVNTFEVSTGYAGSACVAGKGNAFSITPVVTETDCGAKECSFDVDLEIVVLIPLPPCTEIKAGTLNVTSAFSNCPTLGGKSNKLTTTVVKRPPAGCDQPERCEFTIDLDIVVPIPAPRCPNISGNGTFTTRYEDTPPARAGSFLNIISSSSPPTCQDPGTCNTFIDINVDTPIPRPTCPTITTTGGNIRAGYTESNILTFEVLPTHQLNTGTNSPPQCSFDITLDIGVQIPLPPCTIVTASLNVTKLPSSAPPSGSVSTSSMYAPGESCSVDLAFDIGIPAPCIPSISGKAGEAVSGKDQSNTATIFVAQTGECSFDITPYISVKAITECPTFSEGKWESSSGGGSSYGGYEPIQSASVSIIAAGGADCEYEIKFNAATKTLSGGGITIKANGTTVGSGTIKVTATEISAEINLDATECPSEGGGGGGAPGPIGPSGPTGPRGLKGDKGDRGVPGVTGIGLMGPPGAPGMMGPVGPGGAGGGGGAAGDTGATGPAGPPGVGLHGLPGPAGPAGPSGPDGCVGPAGEQGDAGPAGPAGPAGVQGAIGPQGPAGPQGEAGPQGNVGAAGVIGLQGVKGDKGDSGPSGPQGISGPRGQTGPRGDAGPSGPNGAPGATGLRGVSGARGLQGVTGIEGPIGPRGLVGPIGANGAVGPRGATGSPGLAGSVGPAGVQGVKGNIGSTGSAGPPGATGLLGPVGPKGNAGNTGSTGPIGPAGARGPAGSRGPQGNIGVIGAAGPRGVTGPSGASGATGATGASGATGATGPRGTRGSIGPRGGLGASGATGPEGLRGLKGDTGATGLRGITRAGIPGATGFKGATGVTGPCGGMGDIGATGVRGASGPSGLPGIIGASGPTGPRGVIGVTGVRGITGATGPRGATGPQAVLFSSTFVSSKPNILNGTITITDENTIGADITLNTTTLAADADFFNSFLVQIGLDNNGNPVNPLLRAKLKVILEDLLR